MSIKVVVPIFLFRNFAGRLAFGNGERGWSCRKCEVSMSWEITARMWPSWTESIQKRVCRYLLQRYLGQYFQEKLSLDQLNVDVLKGTGNVNDVVLDSQVRMVPYDLIKYCLWNCAIICHDSWCMSREKQVSQWINWVMRLNFQTGTEPLGWAALNSVRVYKRTCGGHFSVNTMEGYYAR